MTPRSYLLYLLTPVVFTLGWPGLSFWSRGPAGNLLDHSEFGNTSRDGREECLSEDKRRRGLCMNTYECRIQQGKSHGSCALGFGVCCIFTTSCGGEVINNLTYVISPGFPDLIERPMNCSVIIRGIEQPVSQLRLDFVHFNIGQPDRRTGVCAEDVMEIRNGNNSFQLCGWNSGQHVYMDIAEGETILDFRLPSTLQSRMWEMSIVQLPFEQRAPAGCLQYFEMPRGTIRTLNYLPNGRYLAGQDHLICVRQEQGMCSISYAPCTPNSFRIGPSRNMGSSGSDSMEVEGSGTGPMESGQNSGSRCRDRVLIPCDFEEFITPGNNGAGICDMEHCGTSLCPRNELEESGNCRVETSATPFRIRVAFGPGEEAGSSPEDYLGMCLMYEQQPCMA